ncbi:MAG: ATP-binding cassette domain-containing protein [Oscillospiraceae bacterium]
MEIELKTISKSFKTHKIFDNLSFSFKGSTIYGVVGPNGIGKTTLFKCIVGLLDVDKGEILLNGKIIDSLNRNEIVCNISYLLSTGLINHLSGWENVSMFAKLFKIEENKIVGLFNEFDLAKAKDKKVKDYSLGMKQRLALIVSLMHIERKIIILDEPYLGLDPIGIKCLNNKLLELKTDGYIIIVSNHQLHESEKIFDEVIFLTNKNIIVKKSEKANDTSLSETFEKIYAGGNE